MVSKQYVPLGSIYGINTGFNMTEKAIQHRVSDTNREKHVSKGVRSGHYTQVQNQQEEQYVVNCCVCHQPLMKQDFGVESSDNGFLPSGTISFLPWAMASAY